MGGERTFWTFVFNCWIDFAVERLKSFAKTGPELAWRLPRREPTRVVLFTKLFQQVWLMEYYIYIIRPGVVSSCVDCKEVRGQEKKKINYTWTALMPLASLSKTPLTSPPCCMEMILNNHNARHGKRRGIYFPRKSYSPKMIFSPQVGRYCTDWGEIYIFPPPLQMFTNVNVKCIELFFFYTFRTFTLL